MANEHYHNFVDEALVAPIRSVLIVDDQYPTYDEILLHRECLNSGARLRQQEELAPGSNTD